jgi:hypothetical protein
MRDRIRKEVKALLLEMQEQRTRDIELALLVLFTPRKRGKGKCR